MYHNLNYYYRITDPLHTANNYTEQVSLVMSIMKNMTYLESDMESASGELQKVEEDLHSNAKEFF